MNDGKNVKNIRRVHFSLDQNEYDILYKVSKNSGVTMSKLIRFALKYYYLNKVYDSYKEAILGKIDEEI